VYGASVHFSLNKESDSYAYFSDFYLDRLVRYDSYSGATSIVTTSTNLSVASAYSSTNVLRIRSSTSRFIAFSVDFGNNTYVSDIVDAGVIFSSDFTTMVGGNNSTFFFIAQKASSMASVSSADIQTTWLLANFAVDSTGLASVSSTASVTPSGTGGRGLLAFTGQNSSTGAFKGETALTDSGVGAFVFGFDTSGGSGTATADGTIDGAFLLSPNKDFLLGYNFLNDRYFAASR
jgi:hypothetical protein